jgi:hypothetical protein
VRRSLWKSKSVSREDREAGDRVDECAAWDLHDDEHDPEGDQRDQRPEEVARERRQVAPRCVAGGAESGDEQGVAPPAPQTACGSAPS